MLFAPDPRRGWLAVGLPLHRPKRGAFIRQLQHAQVNEPEPLVQCCAALAAGLQIRRYAVGVAAIERWSHQRVKRGAQGSFRNTAQANDPSPVTLAAQVSGRPRAERRFRMIVGASTVAIVAIAAVVIVALIVVMYVVPRGGRRRGPKL
jgi:hypothetical protein